MGDSGYSGYHMEAQRKARMLMKKTESMARIQELQQGNFNSVTFNPTVGDCLHMPGPTEYCSTTTTNNHHRNNNNNENGFQSAANHHHHKHHYQPQLPLLAVGQTSYSSSRITTPIFSSRPSTGGQSGLRTATPQSGRFSETPSPAFGRPMSSSSGFSPEPHSQTPGMDELLGQQRSVYSTSMFPEYEDDRELFDTFTYI